jgi:endogenous inhibitor of DNA gyrase (YacG/DUF329 family)
MSQETKKTLKCPICKKEVAFDGPEMPFCSERCRMIDLGNWASEKYVISSPIQHDLEDELNEDE